MVKLLPEQLRFLRNRDRRLVRKYEGPIAVLAKVGPVSYKLDLPSWMTVHPVFHVSNLKPYHPDQSDDQRNKSTRPPITKKAPATREVEEILAERIASTSRRSYTEYLVKWRAQGEEETSWEKATDLQPFKQKIEEFLQSNSTRTSKL
ncbi:hypothetical protein M5689_011090 [Euphorbia peplus]|nr:hypothetical protein M5689_011090 [Euphorbia peplus]